MRTTSPKKKLGCAGSLGDEGKALKKVKDEVERMKSFVRGGLWRIYFS